MTDATARVIISYPPALTASDPRDPAGGSNIVNVIVEIKDARGNPRSGCLIVDRSAAHRIFRLADPFYRRIISDKAVRIEVDGQHLEGIPSGCWQGSLHPWSAPRAKGELEALALLHDTRPILL